MRIMTYSFTLVLLLGIFISVEGTQDGKKEIAIKPEHNDRLNEIYRDLRGARTELELAQAKIEKIQKDFQILVYKMKEDLKLGSEYEFNEQKRRFEFKVVESKDKGQ